MKALVGCEMYGKVRKAINKMDGWIAISRHSIGKKMYLKLLTKKNGT